MGESTTKTKKWLCSKCIEIRESGEDCPECGQSEKDGLSLVEDYKGTYHFLQSNLAIRK